MLLNDVASVFCMVMIPINTKLFFLFRLKPVKDAELYKSKTEKIKWNLEAE